MEKPFKPLRSSAPPDSLLHPQRPYVCAARTDVRATFERIRAQRAAHAARPALVVLKGK